MACRYRQRGQGLVETIVVIPVFGALLLGIFQAILFYRAKAVVDYAALQAARRGATHFADKGAMCKGLAAGLMPLYTHEPTVGGVDGATAGYGKAWAQACIGPNKVATIEIISPTRAMFDAWKEPQYDGVQAIPNDSLMFRGDAVKAGVTIQDANLLKIRVTYRYPLIVPVIDRLIGSFDPRLTAATCLTGGCYDVYSLKIESQAIVRMQTPLRDRDLLADSGGPGGGAGGSPSGGGAGGGSGGGGSGAGNGGGGSGGGPAGGGNDGGNGGDGGGGDGGQHPPCTAG